jgi:hypothetical protein
MRFVWTVFLAVAFVGGARAIHPPMEPTPVISTTGGGGGGGGTVHITSVSSPEPGGVTLAVIALLGGSGYGLMRRKR